ncbi:MAG TPA: YIP1 family protein [Anaerolineales bacterium]|nr:YIP1 family protein [Anaerolineales bacterium]
MTNDIPNPPVPVPPPVQSNPPQEPAAPSIFQTWVDALTKPYQGTYAAIARSPRASSTNAFLWVFISSLILSFLSVLVAGAMRNRMMEQFGIGQNLPRGGGLAFAVICGAPIAAVLAVLFFALFVGIMHLIARAFNGRANFDQLAYAIAAISVPVSLIQAALRLLGAIPFVGYCFDLVSLLLSLYALVLMVVAVMGVEQIGLGGALLAVLILPVIICLCVVCAVIVGATAFASTFRQFYNGGSNPFPFPIPTP